jgi:hypothetical protein
MQTWVRSHARLYRSIRGWVLTSIPLVVVAFVQCTSKGGGGGGY